MLFEIFVLSKIELGVKTRLTAQPVDHRFDSALVKLAESSELVLDVICHPFAHPVNSLTEQKALIVMDDYLFILLVDLSAAAELVKILSYDFVAYLHEIMDEYLLAVGIKTQTAALPWINVHDGNGASQAYLAPVATTPVFYLIDRGNNIVRNPSQIEDIEAEIEKLL